MVFLPMRILMIAPEPFFEPRGTPFSEYHRIRALLELGHTVDLVTYPFGRDVAMPGLRVFRCARPPFIRNVRIGPSPAKIPRRPSSQLTSTPCRVQACASTGPAGTPANAEIRIENKSARVMIIPSPSE